MQLSGQYTYYFPKQYRYYSPNLRQLFDYHDYLADNFNNSIFPTATCKMGHQTISLKHTNSDNYFADGCHIYSGDSYNHKCSGHIILFNLKLVIEFPGLDFISHSHGRPQ